MTVVMTGATGFLGLHLLHRHLAAGRHVTVLSHAGSAPALERIESFLERSGGTPVRPASVAELVEVVEVDIAEERMGLSAQRHRSLGLSADELWHVAASVSLHGDDETVWRTNVNGTEQLLRLASVTRPDVALRHVSTAFVAGRARTGLVAEEDSLLATGFENTYEKSKHAAEGLVRDWTRATGRSTLLLRPSILVPGTRWWPTSPTHTMATLQQIFAAVVSRTDWPGARLVLRFAGDPRARLNLLQVDWAADAMVRLAALPARPGAHAFHVTHPQDVPVRTIASAIEDVSPVRIRIMPAAPAAPELAEQLLYQRTAGFLPYLHHRRSFAGTRLRQVLPELAPPAPIDRDHLRRSSAPGPPAHSLSPSAGPPAPGLAAAAGPGGSA